MSGNEEILNELKEIKELLREITFSITEKGAQRPNSIGRKLAEVSTHLIE